MSLGKRLLIGAVLWTLGSMVISHLVAIGLSRNTGRMLIFHTSGMSMTAVLLLLAGLVVVRRGVSPLEKLRARLKALRAGEAARLDGTYPTEVQPLVSDLNALLDDRDQAVARARAKAGDLAHGLKTPLAVLAQEADRASAMGQPELAGTIRQQVDRMRRQVDYHLAHARAAAAGTNLGLRAEVAPAADGLVRTLMRLHAERGLTIAVDVPGEHAVRCQAEDLEEMLGNLLDNACKWSRSRVGLASRLEAPFVVVEIVDDGPGLDASLFEAVLQRGVRADEAAPGSGFGLAIVRELAELYGGSIALDAAPGGGLRARLRLPAAEA